ncbi:BspA family leucine-rich repeat surface protein [Lactobacillus sp. CC-MHH1034]|uniref:DUF285 domain-containing protein n=1 Tax=Agrilactobacillus fermenti TaxID=2586909 RepID=UPI001E288CD7|nr:DUF285 domain-containing protein [Agrilactobacillus fermenti]MCD2255788.1 BspA family leucine-rich repeat surface protein [Agrilactobacillus fermenti]
MKHISTKDLGNKRVLVGTAVVALSCTALLTGFNGMNLTGAPQQTMAATNTIASGTFGTANWDIDSAGTLTIHAGTLGAGKGNWDQYKNKINAVKVDKGVIANQDSSHLFDGLFNGLRDGEFSLDVSNLDTSHVTDMNSMFKDCARIRSLDVSNFDTSHVTDMSHIFDGCDWVRHLDVSKFNTANVTNMSSMFAECTVLDTPNVSNFNTSKVTDMSNMFYYCSGYGFTNIDLSNFDTSKVTDMSGMFNYCAKLNSLDLKNFDTSKVENMSGMFESCGKLTNLNINNFNTDNVINMLNMFNDCGSLKQLNVSSFNTSKVRNMSGMFNGCSSLQTLDLSNFNTSSVSDYYTGMDSFDTGMSSMFTGCWSLKQLDLSNFDTSNVTNMDGMFASCDDLKSLNISSFNTQKVTNMNSLFEGDKSLSKLDLSSFNTSNVSNMVRMFYGCTDLSALDLSNIDTSNVPNGYSNQMFMNCPNLWELKLGPATKTNIEMRLPDAPGNNTPIKDVNDPTGNYQSISNKWQVVDPAKGGTDHDPKGALYSASDIMQNHANGSATTTTYVWQQQPEDQGVADLKDLYTNVKSAIWNANALFTSSPANSFKYKNDFGGRSIFGALDNAYNTKNRTDLINMMHQSIAKVHQSIGSLQVNETTANSLGLNVDQLKTDLAKDAVPYDYSNQDDITGINNQLTAYNQVRSKYAKLISQGVFEKSAYWSN